MHQLLHEARRAYAIHIYWIITCCLTLQSIKLAAAELEVGKVCPVKFQQRDLGILVFSRAWYHSGRTQAAYQASDNATGVGLEIHLFTSPEGQLSGTNQAQCDRYRMLQVRTTNTKLDPGERASQIDVPPHFNHPFYDSPPLEHGYGVHQTPEDHQDKPWQGRPVRASTVSIYDTPYVSDSYGKDGEDIRVRFETCVVCSRESQYDSLLSCGRWGYTREFMGGMTGWAEPEFTGVQCLLDPSDSFKTTLDESARLEYSFWLNWR